MKPPTNVLFTSDLWQRALERFAGDTRLSVKLFDADERVVLGPVNSTPLFKLLDEKGYDPGIFAECARLCLAQTNGRPAVMVSEVYGLAVVGTSLVLEGKVVGAAVGGYAFVDFSQLSEIQRLAKNAGIKFEQLWKVAREQKPVPKRRLMLDGELLQVLGDALLRENHRTRQYEDAVLKLQETAREKDAAHRELQQTASALRESELRYRNLFESMDEGYCIIEMIFDRPGAKQAIDYRFVEVNPAFEAQAGMRDVTGKRMLEFVLSIEEHWLANYSKVALTGQPVRFANEYKTLNRWFDVYAFRVGQPEDCRIAVLFTDITPRKRTEQALREAGERFRFMAESMPQKMFTATAKGDVDYFNPQWMEFTGLSFEQIKDWGWTQFIHPDDVEENLRRWRHSIATGEPFHFEHRFRRANGIYHWHFSRALPMLDASGDIVMWIGSNADIQPIKDQEERLRKTEKMAAAGQLAASMAHEINNPLSSVTNSLYLLEKHTNLDESARSFVTTAATELARVSRIVKQSLSYYRVGSIPRDLDLGQIVKESLQIFGEKLQRIGIEVRPKIDLGTQLVGFPDELRQVIDNLILNALEAMPNGGRLSISVHDSFDSNPHRDRRKGVRLTIADSGLGIPKEHKWRIFEPFFTTKAEKGTGLGLWILQGIIAKHEGVMSLRSSDSHDKSGTVISIFLPSHVRAYRKPRHSKSESVA